VLCARAPSNESRSVGGVARRMKTLPIFDCRLLIGRFGKKSRFGGNPALLGFSIGNRQSAIGNGDKEY